MNTVVHFQLKLFYCMSKLLSLSLWNNSSRTIFLKHPVDEMIIIIIISKLAEQPSVTLKAKCKRDKRLEITQNFNEFKSPDVFDINFKVGVSICDFLDILMVRMTRFVFVSIQVFFKILRLIRWTGQLSNCFNHYTTELMVLVESFKLHLLYAPLVLSNSSK